MSRGGVRMLDERDEVIEHIKQEDEEFRRLVEEHVRFEAELEGLSKIRYLTGEQELEKRRIQKLKLLGKDKIAEIIRRYKASRPELFS